MVHKAPSGARSKLQDLNRVKRKSYPIIKEAITLPHLKTIDLIGKDQNYQHQEFTQVPGRLSLVGYGCKRFCIGC